MNKKTRIAAIAAVAVVIIAVAVSWPRLWWPLAKSFNKTFSLAPASEAETAGWKTYRDDYYGYEFRYPADLKIVDNSTSPTIEDVSSEIAVETNKQSAGPDVLLTVFAFAQDLQFMGELNFDLDGRQGAAGCIYEAKQCSFAFQKTNQHHSGDKGIMIRAKYSPNPVQMIDPVAQKILATFKLFDGERMKEEGVKKAICRKFLCEEGWGDDFKAFADEQGVVAIKKGLKLEKMDESTYKASGFYYSKDKDPSEGGVILTVTFKGGQWAVADVSFEE